MSLRAWRVALLLSSVSSQLCDISCALSLLVLRECYLPRRWIMLELALTNTLTARVIDVVRCGCG